MTPDGHRELATALRAASASRGQGVDKAQQYWRIGQTLQQLLGERAAYGEHSIDTLAAQLNVLPRTLYRARRFYQRCPSLTTWSGLSWSHCRLLVGIDDEGLRRQLVSQAQDHGWSVRQLQSRIHQLLAPGGCEPRRGRPATFRLRCGRGTACLDLGFGIHLALDALTPLTDRARRLVATGADIVVELAQGPDGYDLRPVWGAADKRLYTYPLHNVSVVSHFALCGWLELGPHCQRQLTLTLRGVPAVVDDPAAARARLARWLDTNHLVVSIDAPGPPVLADLFSLDDDAASVLITAATGVYVNAELVDAGT